MSKLGRYSADRKKIETLNADTTLKEADCGTIFGLLSGSSPFTVTLPPLDTAGRGWCKFVYVDSMANGANATIAVHSDDASTQALNIQRVASSGSHLGANNANETSGVSGSIREASSVAFSDQAAATNDTIELIAWVPKSSDDASARKGWYGHAILSSSQALT